jgi:hypothetical protein
VTGAAFGILLADGGTVIVAVAVAVAVPGAGALVLTPDVPGDEVPPEAGVLPKEAGTGVEVFTDGEKVGTVGDEDEPEQAETAIGASTIRAPQQRAVILARNAVRAIGTRTFMEPSSCAPHDDCVPSPGVRNPNRKEKRMTDLVTARAAAGGSPKTPMAEKVRPVTGADVQWPVYLRNIRLTE